MTPVSTTSVPRARDLPASARAILRLLAETGSATRPHLAEVLGLSKPTVSEAITLLQRRALVGLDGVTQGVTGRSAAVCRVLDSAGCVVGVDAGSTQVRIRAQTLDGRPLIEESAGTSPRQRHVNARTIDVASRLMRGALETLTTPIHAITVAVPTSVSPVFKEPGDHQAMRRLTTELSDMIDADLRVENNVNCAAVGEHRHGAGQGQASFSYLQIGVKIGLGTIYDGDLFRGAMSAAGEPARMPFPWADGASPERGGLERHLGATALMRRCRRQWQGPKPPRDAAELFSKAASGVPAARDIVDDHAVEVGRLLAAVVCLMDPGLLVLGGGIGQNPLLLSGAEQAVSHLAWPTPVVSTTLGDQATVLGATALAADRALDALCGPRRPHRLS